MDHCSLHEKRLLSVRDMANGVLEPRPELGALAILLDVAIAKAIVGDAPALKKLLQFKEFAVLGPVVAQPQDKHAVRPLQ